VSVVLSRIKIMFLSNFLKRFYLKQIKEGGIHPLNIEPGQF